MPDWLVAVFTSLVTSLITSAVLHGTRRRRAYRATPRQLSEAFEPLRGLTRTATGGMQRTQMVEARPWTTEEYERWQRTGSPENREQNR